MGRIPGIPADSTLDYSSTPNATTFATNVFSWLTTIADAFGTAAHKEYASKDSSAEDNALLEMKAFGDGAFANVGGTGSDNIITIKQLEDLKSDKSTPTIGDKMDEVPNNLMLNTKLTQAFGNVANKRNVELYSSSAGLNITSSVNVTLHNNGDLDNFDAITLCMSRNSNHFSTTVPTSYITTGNKNVSLYGTNRIGIRRNNNGRMVTLSFSGSNRPKLKAIIGVKD